MYRFCRRAASVFGWFAVVVIVCCTVSGFVIASTQPAAVGNKGLFVLQTFAFGVYVSGTIIATWIFLRFIAWCAKPDEA